MIAAPRARGRRATIAALALCLATPVTADPLTPDANAAFNDWLHGVQARIVASARKATGYPRPAHVTVALTIQPDGAADDIHALETSDPDPRFRALAEHVVVLAEPFPPMPANVGRSEGVAISVPLFFNPRPPTARKP